MENYLYLLELFVEHITFSSNLPEYPKPSQVIISGEMGDFIKLSVNPGSNYSMNGASQKDMALNCGQSTLFSISPEDLLSKINHNPFKINLFVDEKEVANADLGFTKDFYTLVKNSLEAVTPAVMQDQFLLKENNTDRIMGDIKATVKLSCFGKNINTSFRLISGEEKHKRYVVKGSRIKAAFECQKLTDENSGAVLPLAPMLTSDSYNSKGMTKAEDEAVSLMALFKSNLDPRYSSLPEEFAFALSNFTNNTLDRKTISNITFDIISLRERPEENKCVDLRIKGGSKGFIFEFGSQIPSPFDPLPKESYSMSSTPDSSIKDDDTLTIDKINRMLCKNKDCPAAKKFKEFGIGPLANTKGLGTVHGDTTLPVTYGMSQTYGIFDEYGPYGLFSRPKRPSDPFIAKQDNSNWAENCWEPKRRKNKESEITCSCTKCNHNACYCKPQKSPLRLNGGADEQLYEPLRLTGGGVLDYDDVKSPFHECKEVMEQFDEILRKYKKALGPCGKTTCPFAPNVTKESCKKMCNHEMDVYSDDNIYQPPQPKEPDPCTPQKKNPLKGACGSPKCAYAKYKHGLKDEDAEMELQYLPSAPSGKCGHPKCPYPVETDLPPIHWDCPDPLPKGRCKNPDCPYLPKEIKCLNELLNKGPCGNFNCPFSPPPPCSSPDCPFASKKCPYEPQEQNDENIICENPDCPFASNYQNSSCDNPDCPHAKKPNCSADLTDKSSPCFMPHNCPLPSCPYMMNPYLQNLLLCLSGGNAEVLQLCYGGPGCPFEGKTQQTKQGGRVLPSCVEKPSPCYIPEEFCSNPDCPHANVDEDSCMETDLCENPECPYAPKTCYIKPTHCPPPPSSIKVSPCINPYLQALLSYCMPLTICPDGVCPYGNKDALQICLGNLEGPPGKTQQEQTCMQKEKNATDICENPNCPYVQKSQGDKASIGLDDGVEYTSGTRTDIDNAPCTKKTCTLHGGELVCTCCGADGEMIPGDVEYKVDERTSLDLVPCTPKTCKSKGGKFICDVCPCSGKAAGNGTKKKRRKKRRGKYIYSIGDKYPGVQIGHKACVMPAFNVPPKMGWLWNIHTPCMQLKPRRGWRPGAIAKTIAERIRKHREAQGLEMLQLKDLRKGRKGHQGYDDSGTSINIQPKPTLHIKKQDGCYWITMNPLKDPHTLVENENPYMECTPLQFKITKNKDNEKADEYKSCFCGDEENDKQESSSDSELEIEFTPPAGIIHPERFKKKRNVVHCDTQYLTTDFETKVEQKSEKGSKKGKGKKEKKDKKDKKGKKGKKK